MIIYTYDIGRNLRAAPTRTWQAPFKIRISYNLLVNGKSSSSLIRTCNWDTKYSGVLQLEGVVFFCVDREAGDGAGRKLLNTSVQQHGRSVIQVGQY